MRAHQHVIREQHAAEDVDSLWWEHIDLNLSKADVCPISYKATRSVIEKYEWLGTMPTITRFTFGIFFEGYCGGVVVYSTEYTENLGVWNKYGFTGKILCLSRGACVHWTPVGTASALIRRSMKLLPPQYEVITATTDHEAGEIGTIYQACGFHFAKMNTNGRYQAVGISSRSLRVRGLKNKAQIEAAGLVAKKEHQKGRYFGFRGPAAIVRKHTQAIATLIRPYPKRAEQVSSRDTVGSPGKAGGSSPAPLQHAAASKRGTR